MIFARRALIFCYGLFTIAAQALLFREFITTFEGNDIAVGAFFGSWFLWVALGAFIAYKCGFLADRLLRRLEFLLLAYIPAFVLQWILVLQARELAGIEPYALFPIKLMIALSLLVNAPVSIITGMFFPLACRWVQPAEGGPVSRVYITEAAGSFLGGLGVTILLGLGTNPARIFLLLALIVSTATFLVQLARAKKWAVVLVPVCIALCLTAGVDRLIMGQIRAVKWARLLSKESLRGSFQTAQAEYLYGIYQGQWIAVREGSVCETLPDEESAGQVAAIHLSQKPDAKRVLVIGSGLGLCREFLRLGQIEQVTWAHCDNEYVRKLLTFIPDEFKITDKRFRPLAGDVRLLPAEEKGFYDIVILNLPDVTSSVLNRYYTLEFYRQVKDLLTPAGVFGIRISGGENIMGTELVNLGASTKLTLEQVFLRFVIIPGEDTWFVASDSENLTGRPGTLADRFAGIKGASDIFPPAGLLSIYRPGRAAVVLENYGLADLPEKLLINRDTRPLAHLYSLLLAAKQSGAAVTRFVKKLALAGVGVFLIPLLLLVVLRVVYVLKTPGRGNRSGFESTFLVFSAGWVGIGVVIVLMYLYQTRFGSLYLYIGVISSLFMMGLTAGGAFSRYLLINRKMRAEALLFTAVLAQAALLTTIGRWPQSGSIAGSHLTFALAFVLSGLCTGTYFPLAAAGLADSAFEVGRAGGKLELADHLGAAAGAFLTGLVIVPVLGASLALVVFILLLAANLPLAILRMYRPGKIRLPDTVALRLRRAGYILFGVGACLVVGSNVLAAAALSPALPYPAVQALAEQLRPEKISAPLERAGRQIDYYKLYDSEEKPAGYIFSSGDLAAEVSGFGGRINLAVRVDASGKLVDFHILSSNETPVYLELLSLWRDRLKGRSLFQDGAFADVDAVAGATVSSKAVISALETSGRRFAAEILGRAAETQIGQKEYRGQWLPDIQGIYLIGAFSLALIVTCYGGFATRLAVLFFTLIVGGIVLNAQYSTEQIATLLTGHFPAVGFSGAFLLVVGVPVFAAFFGNYYCGYVCPFGAAQELVGFILPGKFRPAPTRESMQPGRFVKYVVLAVVIAGFFVSRNRSTLAADPLIEVFSGSISSLLLATAGPALIVSVLYGRFWCRYLCPAGAFLSLLGAVAPFRRLLPAKRFGQCEFGVASKTELDCLFCDRCRYGPALQFATANGAKNLSGRILARYVLVPALAMALLVSVVSMRKLAVAVQAGFGQTPTVVSAAGQARDVDLPRIRKMIRQKRLSEQEARFYTKPKED